jgi:hypothetical protein
MLDLRIWSRSLGNRGTMSAVGFFINLRERRTNLSPKECFSALLRAFFGSFAAFTFFLNFRSGGASVCADLTSSFSDWGDGFFSCSGNFIDLWLWR